MRHLLLIPLLLTAIGAMAETSVRWSSPDHADLLEIAAELRASDDLPDQLTRLVQETDIQIDKNTVRRHVRDVWFYPSSQDVQSSGMDRIYFDEQTDRLTVHTAASVDERGRLHRFDPNTLKITDVDIGNTFSDTRQAVIALPGLGAGSVAMLEYTVVTKRALLEMDWAEMLYSENIVPIGSWKLSVEWPEDESIQWAGEDNGIDCVKEENSLVCSGEDIPALRPKGQPSWPDVANQVVVAEKRGWDQIVEKSRSAFNQALRDTRGSEALLEELGIEALAESEKIAQIHAFVARDIRYVSMSELVHKVTPHSVASTILSRYGDCKDKSAVLYHLLQRLGLDASPVLVATERSDPDRLLVPSMGYFDHMVVCFDWNGSRRCLDATDANTDWQHTPAWIQGKVALDLSPGARPTVIEPAMFRWKIAVESSMDFNPEGGAEERQKRTYIGEYAGTMRNFLSRMDDSERLAWAVEDYQGQVSDLVEPVFEFEGADTLGPEMTISSSAQYGQLLSPGEPLSYFEYSAWLTQEIYSLYLEDAGRDEQFPGLHVTTTHRFDVGPAWSLTALTPELEFSHAFGSMTRRVERLKDDRLQLVTELKIPRQRVRKTDIGQFNGFLDLMVRESKIRFAGKAL